MLFLNLEPPKSVETLQLPIMSVASSQDTTKLKRHSSSIGNINTDKNSLEYSAPNKEIIPINQQKSYTESNSKNTFTSSLEYDILARKRLPKEEGTPIETTTGIKEGKNEPKVEESPPEVDTATLNQVKFYKSFLISFHKFANLCSGWGLLQSSRSIWIQRGIWCGLPVYYIHYPCCIYLQRCRPGIKNQVLNFHNLYKFIIFPVCIPFCEHYQGKIWTKSW